MSGEKYVFANTTQTTYKLPLVGDAEADADCDRSCLRDFTFRPW